LGQRSGCFQVFERVEVRLRYSGLAGQSGAHLVSGQSEHLETAGQAAVR
jgi:hypothetical protein